MATVTALASGKGGVGKSTLTVGLGVALAEQGKRVLLVDGDAGLSSLDELLGLSEDLVYDVSDIANGRIEPLRAAYAVPGRGGLFLLPAPKGKPLSPEMMKAIVTVFSRWFDRILIDCPAGLGINFFSAVAPADEVLLVTTTDAVSVRGATVTRSHLAELGKTNFRLIINRLSTARFRRDERYPDLDAVIDEIGARLLGVVPDDKMLELKKVLVQPNQRGAGEAFCRIAERMEGEHVLLPDIEKNNLFQ